MKLVGAEEDIEAEVTLRTDIKFGWQAIVLAERQGQMLTHETEWVDHERDALAAAAMWLRSHFETTVPCIVAITGSKHAA